MLPAKQARTLLVETEGTHSGGIIGSDLEQNSLRNLPSDVPVSSGDIAPIAVFLASGDSVWLTGEQLLATGGIR
jgi:3-oxoacyl-[acyl-carrier protein] reductase